MSKLILMKGRQLHAGKLCCTTIYERVVAEECEKSDAGFLFSALRTHMADFIGSKLPNGEIQMIKLADMSKVKSSAAQKVHQQRFKQASDYAKAVLADPKVCAIYKKRAAKAKKRPRDLAISDFFKGKDLLGKK